MTQTKTNPFSHIPMGYISRFKLPVNWIKLSKCEEFEELRPAIQRLRTKEALEYWEIDLLIGYFRYYLNAPCWNYDPLIVELREAALEAKSHLDLLSLEKRSLSLGLKVFQ